MMIIIADSSPPIALAEYIQDKIKSKASDLNLSGSFEMVAETNTADKAIWNMSLKAK